MKWILRTFVLGAHGALISATFFAIKLLREHNYGPALVFALFALLLVLFLIVWWRDHSENSN
jgi:hypothetical protein